MLIMTGLSYITNARMIERDKLRAGLDMMLMGASEVYIITCGITQKN